MSKKALIIAMGLVVALSSGAVAADKYMVDAGHSTVGFGVKHMVVTTVKGKFNTFSGEVMFDPAMKESSVMVTIDAASIDTGDEKRDGHLTSEDFLLAEKYPNIEFVSKKITQRGEGFVAHGQLTIRDVTKDVEIPFELAGPIEDPWGNMRFGISGTLEINRKEYGLAFDNKLANGGLIVGDEVKIELDIEFIKPKSEG